MNAGEPDNPPPRADAGDYRASTADSAAAPPLTFPDLPRLELDQLLAQLVDRAQEVMATQGRLRGLLRANQMVTGTSPCRRCCAGSSRRPASWSAPGTRRSA